MADLTAPERGDEVAWIRAHLGDLVRGEVTVSTIAGGQQAADAALADFQVRGYAARRSEVWPTDRRGASRLSPYIRHGLLSLPRVWDHVGRGPERDSSKFRDELLWQEYARHVYARVGTATQRSLRYAVEEHGRPYDWPEGMACVDLAVGELRDSGWIPNQTRMWLASQWSVRDGAGWREGEDAFFRHLLDGSRAANRIGWQWTVGALTGKAYGFSRWQVEKRAPGLCSGCALARRCPIQSWPPDTPPEPRAHVDPLLRSDPDLAQTSGLADIARASGSAPQLIWLTAESLGDADPALLAHPDLPVVFTWDIPLLQRLRLASQRLVFLAQCLADLAERRDVIIRTGSPSTELRGIPLVTTFAPVPGWRRHRASLEVTRVEPWPWLVPPHDGPVTSFTAWRRRARV